MECSNCELKQRQFCCVPCLRSHLRDFRVKIKHAESDRDEMIARATRMLKNADEQRLRKAELASAEAKAKDVANAVQSVREKNAEITSRIRARRAAMTSRRRTLATARALPSSSPSGVSAALATNIQNAIDQLASLSASLAQARTGLVQELVEVFDVVEVGGRPALGGRLGTKGEWIINGLVLPVPGDVRRYPPLHINAVLTHSIHFLGLLAFYLGIKLPFVVHWLPPSITPSSSTSLSASTLNVAPLGHIGNSASSPSKLGVGVPWIGAIRGAESGSWARWHVKHPLHLSSDPANTPQPDIRSPNLSLDASAAEIPAASAGLEATAGTTPPSVFTTALAMLLYNVAYAAHTQALDVPLAGVGDALGNLWALCCAPALGRRSHETGAPAFSAPVPIPIQAGGGGGGANTAVESGMPGMGALLASELGVGIGAGPNSTAFVVTAPGLGSRLPSTIGAGPIVGAASGLPPVLPPPTPPGFPLDFAQVLQATAAGPRRTHRDNRGTAKKGKDDDKSRDKRKSEKAPNAIAEEDEWDLVEAEAL